ncbi:MAG TPA: hypothetical protein P5155_02930 [Candidatus Absconditabacterales bacterium]|nr:hypothetical protein [Candidatus Absconditabacterales bacterium]
MAGIKHQLNLTSKNIGHHFKKHHKKYVFGLISGALLYKTLSLLLASVFLNNLGAHQSFADNTEIPTNTEMENVLATNDENIEATNSEENLDSEASFEDVSNETENSNSVDEELNSANEIEPEVCGLGDIELFSPLSGDILKGEFEISWNYKKTICEEIPLIVKLWDANTQYVTIGEVDSGETSLNFDSSLLYSGYYDITGLNLSGEVIIIHTGEYTGLNTRYFSGHKIVIYSSDMEVLYEGEEFTIDNEAPSLSGVELNTDVTSGNYIGLGKKVSVSFSANEELSGVVVNILGIDADLENKENNNYEYISYLSEGHTTGNIIYNIEFEDLAGNTGYYEGYSNVVFDKDYPRVTKLRFTRTGDDVKLVLNTDKETNLEFVYVLSGTNTGYTINSASGTSHDILLKNIKTGYYYNYSIAIKSLANNIGYVGGYFTISGDDIIYDYQNISGSNMLVGVGFEDRKLNSGSILDSLLVEIDKFNSCKNGIPKFNSVNIPIGLYYAKVKMPELEKSYIRKLVSAFSIVLFERVENAGLDKEVIDKITEEFNDFLVILKLVQDDDNECEQNLSNYYMSKFRSNLIKYNLAEE